MSQEVLEQNQEAQASPDSDGQPQSSRRVSGDSPAVRDDLPLAQGRLVPVTEAIKYRRRAQQAESGLQQFEQQLKETQAQLEHRLEQLATAEAQRDELQHEMDSLRLRSSAERMLNAACVTDVETAMALLDKRAVFSNDPDDKQLHQAVERLMQDKPLLTSLPPTLPDKTASPRLGSRAGAQLAQSAARAVKTGNRRDVAEYLRLRRQRNVNY